MYVVYVTGVATPICTVLQYALVSCVRTTTSPLLDKSDQSPWSSLNSFPLLFFMFSLRHQHIRSTEIFFRWNRELKKVPCCRVGRATLLSFCTSTGRIYNSCTPWFYLDLRRIRTNFYHQTERERERALCCAFMFSNKLLFSRPQFSFFRLYSESNRRHEKKKLPKHKQETEVLIHSSPLSSSKKKIY